MQGIGIISTPPGALLYRDSLKGRVLLELISSTLQDIKSSQNNKELHYILKRLGATVENIGNEFSLDEVFPQNPYLMLHQQISWALRSWGIPLETIDYSNKVELEIPKGYHA